MAVAVTCWRQDDLHISVELIDLRLLSHSQWGRGQLSIFICGYTRRMGGGGFSWYYCTLGRQFKVTQKVKRIHTIAITIMWIHGPDLHSKSSRRPWFLVEWPPSQLAKVNHPYHENPRQTNRPHLAEHSGLVPWVFAEGGFYCISLSFSIVCLYYIFQKWGTSSKCEP